MLEQFSTTLATYGVTPQMLVIFGAGLGMALTVYGVAGTLAGRNPALKRMQRHGPRRAGSGADALSRHRQEDPRGIMRALMPSDQKELSQVRRQLEQAGLRGSHSVRNFYLVRLIFGIVLPVAVVALFYTTRAGLLPLPAKLDSMILSLGLMRELQIVSVMIGLGFYGPLMWLRGRVSERQQKVREAFPNALDLIQISVEAGVAFDAALERVAEEIAPAAPIMAEELMVVHHEVQAGRPRERALMDMAERTGVEQVRSFANVVTQAIRFGTSMSTALTAYAKEMRVERELRAQEMANKLPVKMSGVMASLMLPALIMLTVGPVVIRYIRYFGG